jgi:hypothetical protein
MAKKAKPVKKRKSTTVALAPKEEGEAGNIGTVAVEVQTVVALTGAGVFTELVIEWGCLGLSEEPDKIVETSANNRLLDPKRPIETSEEGLHVFFDPPLQGAGNYGFKFQCTYNEAAEARAAAAPKSDDERRDEEDAA